MEELIKLKEVYTDWLNTTLRQREALYNLLGKCTPSNYGAWNSFDEEIKTLNRCILYIDILLEEGDKVNDDR